ncbi:MAG: universal stress protein [Polyangiaceae bacterium]|nr:universal stress protein [Polyangiaceae bacterium]
MTTQNSTTIVVGVDFSEASELALDTALKFASNFAGVDVHVLHADPGVDNFDASFGTAFDHLEHTVHSRLEVLGAAAGRLNGRVITHIRGGKPAQAIVQLAADVSADLVVVGTHGRTGIRRLVLGSVAETVGRTARCPVWIVRPKDHENIGELPDIEPPCPRCVARQRETHGEQLWCAKHSEPHVRPHRYTFRSVGADESPDSAAYRSTPPG